MIKAVIFDLDGVIVDLKTAHYETLNKALFEIDKNYVISISEHLNKFDGLPTVSKLKILHNEKGLPEKYFKDISKKKQEYTLDYILENVVKSDEISELFIKLKENEIKIIVCSNSVTNTIYAVLLKMNLLKYVDKIFSNENVVFKKPHPEIYFNGISFFGFLPKECLIVEDSPFGIKAANNSGAYVMSVKNSKELNSKKIMSKINNINSESFNEGKWHSDNMNIVIPMAGMGSRFKQNGYKLPKPLIDVNGKPMIQRVVENLNIEAKFIFIVQKSDYEQYNLNILLKLISKNCEIIIIDGITEGAACSIICAEKFIDNDNSLIIANSDQLLEWDANNFYYKCQEENVDGGVVCFHATESKWSFVEIDKDNMILRAAEKEPISNNATAGIYFWKKGSDFIRYSKDMINKNIRVNNEFYVCPVFNQAIEDNKCVKAYFCDKMHGLGTPEDLENYCKNYTN